MLKKAIKQQAPIPGLCVADVCPFQGVPGADNPLLTKTITNTLLPVNVLISIGEDIIKDPVGFASDISIVGSLIQGASIEESMKKFLRMQDQINL